MDGILVHDSGWNGTVPNFRFDLYRALGATNICSREQADAIEAYARKEQERQQRKAWPGLQGERT